MEHGRTQLREWIDRRRFKQREAAAYLTMDETFLSSLLSGRRQPGLTNAVKIERATGIPVESWLPSELDETELAEVNADANSSVDKA